jgi:hypothetical protein
MLAQYNGGVNGIKERGMKLLFGRKIKIKAKL